MTPLEQLRRAREHLSRPEQWFQGAASSRADNPMQGALDGFPCCAVGALRWAMGAVASDGEARKLLVQALPGELASVVSFNDDPDTTHADILALFDRAIAAAEAEQ